MTPTFRSVAPLILAAAVSPAFAQPADRLPPPPASSPVAPTFSFADAYRAAGRPIIAVVDLYAPDATHAQNEQSAHFGVLGTRLRDQFRAGDVLLVPDETVQRVARDAAVQAAAAADVHRAAALIAEQTRAEVVVLLAVRPRTGADASSQIRADYAVVDVRRDALIGQWSYDIAPAAGHTSLDAERVSAYAAIIAADAQQRFINSYRAPAAASATPPYSQPLPSAPAQPAPAAIYVQEPAHTPQPIVVQRAPVYAAPVYSAPVVVREPVYVQQPVYVPTSSWAVSVGYGWGSGRVGFAYGSPGYCAPAYPAYCAPSPCGWGGWGSAFALSLNFGSGHGGHHGGYHGGGHHGHR